MISLTLIIVLVVLFAKMAIDRRRKYEFTNKIPGPRSWPFIGNLPIFAVPRKEVVMAFNKVHMQYMKYNSPIRYWFGPLLILTIDKPEHIETVMTSSVAADKGYVYHIMAESIGYGLIQSNGKKHRSHRKIISMSFKPQILEKHMEKFNTKAEECVKLLGKYIDGDYFQVNKLVEQSCMAMVSEIIMGISTSSDNEDNFKLIKLFSEMYPIFAERLYKPWLYPRFVYQFTTAFRLMTEAVKTLDDFFDSMIHKKAEILEREKDIISDGEKQDIALEWLLQAKDSRDNLVFSHNEIREELLTLYTASVDTTMSTISFALVVMAIKRDIQEKVYSEQTDIFGPDSQSTPIQQEHLRRMNYLHMVVQEVLRMYPIAPSLMRQLNGDLKIGDVMCPKDTNIIINAFCAHRNENVWPNPEEFDPLRFLPEEKAKRHPYSYIPFSAGSRGCIGKEFAFTAIKCIISHVIRNYVLISDWKMEDIKIEADISVRSAKGYKLRITKR